MRRVVITGLGVVTATGCTIADFFAQLLEGRAGTRRIQNLEPALAEQLNCKLAAEVLCFDPSQHFGAKELDQLDRFSQFAVVAAKQALEDA
ncbi:MAG: beta-ketoacyl synthase N-terminal-like domain-containing protein, partial [Candidatus Acidiferrales bacterium]